MQPPTRLSPEEAEVWRETVASVRQGWFCGSEAMLEVFVHAVVTERRLAAALREADPKNDYDFDQLHRLHRGSAMLVASVATKLKLTARATRDTVKLPQISRAAWGDVSELEAVE